MAASQWPGTPVDDPSAAQAWPGEPVAMEEAPEGGSLAQGFFGGFNQGLAQVAGAPVDLVNAGLNVVGLGTERPFLGSRMLMEGMQGVRDVAADVGNQVAPGTFTEAPDPLAAGGMFARGPDTAAGELVNRIGREVGASSLPAAGILAAARGVPVTRAAPTLSQTFLDPIRRTPGRALGGETAAAVGAGTGAYIASEAVPGSPAAEMLGQIAGGFAPTVLANTPTALAGRAAAVVRSRVSDEAQREAARGVVRDFMGERLTTQAREGMQEGARLAEEIPGFSPSLAERTGSPGLVRKQEELEGRMAGTELDAATARRLANEEAVRLYGEGQAPAPASAADPDLVIDAATRRVTDLRARVDDAQASTDASRRAIAGRLAATDRAAQGGAIREAIAAQRAATRQEMASLAARLGINDADVTVEFGRAAREIADEFSPESIFEDLANYPEIISTIRQAGQPTPSRDTGLVDARGAPIVQPGAPARVTFGDLRALRERVSDDLIDALGAANPSRVRVRQLTRLKARVDQVIDDLTRAADPTLADRYRQFRDAYFRDYVDRFEKGVIFRINQRDGRGFYRTPDEQVAASFFAPGGVSAARQFKAVLGGDPAANAALESVVLDDLARAAVRDGVIDPRLAEGWMRNHASVLAEFPAIAGRLRTFADVNDALVRRQAALADRSRRIGDTLLARELRAIDRDSRTAADAIRRAIESPRRMGQLRGAVRGDPEATAALRRAVWNDVVDRPPGDLAAFVDANKTALRIAGFDERHLQALRNIDAARAMMTRVRAPQGSGAIPTSADAFVRTFGIRPEMLANRLRELHTGRSEKAYTITNVLTNILARKQGQYVDEAFKAALYDPEIAEEFSRAIISGRISEPGARRLQARFFALGIPWQDAAEE